MDYKIVNKQIFADRFKRLDIHCPPVARKAKAGQFVKICPAEGEVSIPLTVFEADPQRGIISLIVHEADPAAQRLGLMPINEPVYSVLGPLGVPTPVERKGVVVCIATGVGIGRVLPVARALKQLGNKVIGIIGARTKRELLLEAQMRIACHKIFAATDDGSHEHRGLATDVFRRFLGDQGKQGQPPVRGVYAAGSVEMMETVCELTRPLEIETYVVLDTAMVDCMGLCGACRVVVAGRTVQACVDGPTFDGHKVDFGERPVGQSTVGVQPGGKRVRNFDEVSRGLSKKLAVEEAKRCLRRSSFVSREGCPLGVDIPAFVRFLRDGNPAGALKKIHEQNYLPGICGRLCSAPCEVASGISEEEPPAGIRALERFASDFGRPKFGWKRPAARAGKKIAVVGSGPAGLTAAAGLAARGYRVSVLEAFDQPGGVLRYGIPSFRMPARVLQEEIQTVRSAGVEFRANCYVGKTVGFDELQREGFEAVLLATGAGVPRFQDLPGVNLGGVHYAEEFLLRANLPGEGKPKGNNVVVLGPGSMALDCARIAARLGKHAIWVSPEAPEDKKVLREESGYAREEGVHIEALVRPLEVLGDERHFVRAVKCLRLDYADTRASGQWELTPVPDSEFVLDADSVIIAMGHAPNSLVARDIDGLKVNDDGTLWVDPHNGMTSLKGVFACGNVVTGAGPVVEAMASGKKAAGHIDNYFKSKT